MHRIDCTTLFHRGHVKKSASNKGEWRICYGQLTRLPGVNVKGGTCYLWPAIIVIMFNDISAILTTLSPLLAVTLILITIFPLQTFYGCSNNIKRFHPISPTQVAGQTVHLYYLPFRNFFHILNTFIVFDDYFLPREQISVLFLASQNYFAFNWIFSGTYFEQRFTFLWKYKILYLRI